VIALLFSILAQDPFLEADTASVAPAWTPIPRFRMQLDARAAIDTRFEDRDAQKGELFTAAQFELELELGALTAYAAPELAWSYGFGSTDRRLLFLLPPEAHIGWRKDALHFRFGFQRFAWGTSDLLSPNDILNPGDFRRPLSSNSFVKIPVLAAEASYADGPLIVRLVALPFHTASRFFVGGWDQGLAAPGVIPGLDPAVFELVAPAYLDQWQDLSLLTERPADDPRAGTIAGRATISGDTAELSFTASYGWDPLPLLTADPRIYALGERLAAARAMGQTIPGVDDEEFSRLLLELRDAINAGQQVLQGRFLRRGTFGLDASWAVDPLLLKLDAAYYTNRSMYLWRPTDFRSAERITPEALPGISVAAGADYVYGEQLQLTVEGFLLGVFDVPAGGRLVYLEDQTIADQSRTVWNAGLAGALRGRFWDDRLGVEAGAAFLLTRGDRAFFGQAIYFVDEQHQLSLGAQWIAGNAHSLGRAYGHTDQVFVGYRFLR